MLSKESERHYSIGEAGRLTGLEPHVLRFWETEFEALSPRKSVAGRRVYTDEDIAVIERIKTLLYEKKFTIEGARNYFQNEGLQPASQTEISFDDIQLKEIIREVKMEIREILDLLS